MTGAGKKAPRRIGRADILAMDEYAAVRDARRHALVAMKRNRRLAAGPDATFYFENYETMWMQIHEMLYIERGGEAQIADELAAYAPLVPSGRELVATLMFEIGDKARREKVLGKLGGIEERAVLVIGGEKVFARPESDVERSDSAGRTASVHFLHFPLTAVQVAAFKAPGTPVSLGFDDPRYGHMARMPEEMREALALDLD